MSRGVRSPVEGLNHTLQKVKDLREIPGDIQPLHLWGQNQCWAHSSPQLAQQQFRERPTGCLPFVCNLFESSKFIHLCWHLSQALPLWFLLPVFTSLLYPQDKNFSAFTSCFPWFDSFFSLTLLIHLEFNLVAGQGWGPRIHVTQLDNLNSSLLPIQGLLKGEGASASHEVVFTSQKTSSISVGSSELCPTLLQLPVATLFGAIPWSLEPSWPRAWVLRTHPLPSFLVLLRVRVTLMFTSWTGGVRDKTQGSHTWGV